MTIIFYTKSFIIYIYFRKSFIIYLFFRKSRRAIGIFTFLAISRTNYLESSPLSPLSPTRHKTNVIITTIVSGVSFRDYDRQSSIGRHDTRFSLSSFASYSIKLLNLSLKIQLTGPSYVIFRHIVGTGGCFLRAVKHNRSRKRAAIIHVIARPGCWNTRRVVVVPYIPPSGKLPEYSVPLFEITCAVYARPCAPRLKVAPNFLRPRARTLPIILSPAPVIQRAYVQIQIERLKQVCNYLAPFILGFRNADIAILVSLEIEFSSFHLLLDRLNRSLCVYLLLFLPRLQFRWTILKIQYSRNLFIFRSIFTSK